MKPESLLGIALELIEIVSAPGPYPADARVGRFFRSRRFLGSHDRRVIGEAAYSWLRHFPRAQARWKAWSRARGIPDWPTQAPARLHYLPDILTLARDRLFPLGFEETLNAAKSFSPPEALRSDFLSDGDWPEDPLERLAAQLSLPLWLAERLVEERGAHAVKPLGVALLEQATVDLRVNLRKVSREKARRSLEEELNCPVELTSLSPLGLRIRDRKNLSATRASREGWIEVEDEGSQIVVLSTDPSPGETVLEACAGAGGKTLALLDVLCRGERTAASSPPAALIACDVEPSKLAELERRSADAGVSGLLKAIAISPEGELPEAVPSADLVLVDAPCSGFGTLRRNPDLKLRYGPADIAAFSATQREILERFSSRVKPGGRLAYVTCSLLRAENDAVASAFEAAHPEFDAYPSRWGKASLPGESLEGGRLRLDPVLTGTDGFFVSLWKKKQVLQSQL
jgi:16S rRNA (cytosine967-C5)-methyltransferase